MARDPLPQKGIYRNHYKDVYNFFEQRHPDRYRIYNLCSERSYNKEKFHNCVAEFRFDDHCPPPLALFLPFCQDVDAWLQEHSENVAAIHCNGGKGRTGVMICAYLLYTGAWKTAGGAMKFFGAARSLKSQGVTIPSQRRFIGYFGEMCHRARHLEFEGSAGGKQDDGDWKDSDSTSPHSSLPATAPSIMGFCLSKCLLDGDMTRELEDELDDANNRSYVQQNDSSGGAPFATTSLLAADEVMCLDAIGEGPFGTVYEGRYRGSTVAVKKMKMTALPMKPGARENMEMELEVEATRMGTLRHPNTVLFMGACVQGEYFCVVSEYCTRGSLFDVLHPLKSPHRRGIDKAPHSRNGAAPPSSGGGGNYNSSDGKKKKGLKWSLQLRLALGAAKGLLYLHSADPPLVHGQLKSSNILVDDSWNAKLADFGTRRVADAMGFDRSRLESMDASAGLLRWTAPELLKHGEERVLKGNASTGNLVPQAVDVYSFGMVLWELTTGEIPYAEMQSNREIREYVLSGCRPVMKPGQSNIQWGELITRCWSHNPSRRPSAAEIVTTLESINKTAAKVKKAIGVLNSDRTEYRFDPNKPRSRTNGGTKFKSNVRLGAS